LENEGMNISTFNEWLAAFKVHDIPKMVSLLTDDARINSIVFGTYTGRDEASEYWQQLYNDFLISK
jgi:ketosteroid isomerase-like protein